MKAHLAYESNVRGCSSGEEDNNSGFSVHPTHRILVLEWVSQWYNFLVPLFSVEHLSSFMSCLEDLEYIMESNCKSFKDYLFKDFGTPPDPTHSLSSIRLFLLPSSFVILAFLLPLPSWHKVILNHHYHYHHFASPIHSLTPIIYIIQP